MENLEQNGSFESKIQDLNSLIEKLKDENLNLQDSVKIFKNAKNLLKEAKSILEEARLEIFKDDDE
ncbi:exodeoxyribonuclease VII small subunit [Campylobacter sp. FMV-PI01]|uniref:Exodeoxyribonuclease VII small subunit n=1 Tax=Campylobacter portucalensis TaxID=2608384 RepID=A0A6L5WJ74_9BACT|nr:exodeoxyribonuclease VII small subunit [Campylobacter portucalensis]MSN96522.1 exodeoxyribonuclease VII small subunit [Campylobacter portucalensis]